MARVAHLAGTQAVVEVVPGIIDLDQLVLSSRDEALASLGMMPARQTLNVPASRDYAAGPRPLRARGLAGSVRLVGEWRVLLPGSFRWLSRELLLTVPGCGGR
jgi:hypothetical protein